MQHWLAIVTPFAKEFCMDKQNHNDIAAFPELFDGMEQFIEEQRRLSSAPASSWP
jgi:hypothetical protein